MRKILKTFGILMISFSGLSALYLIRSKSEKRITVVEEFIKHLDFIHTQISFYKMPLYDVFKRLSLISSKELKKIYDDTLTGFSQNENNPFGKAFLNSAYLFGKNETAIISEFSKRLGNSDYDTQLKSIISCKNLLSEELCEFKEYINKNRKTQSTLLINVFIVIVILII